MFPSFESYRFSFRQKASLAVAGGMLQVLFFPKFAITWLSWIALVPLLIAIFREARGQRAFMLGVVFGATFFSGCCYWIFAVLQSYGDVHWTGAVLLFALLIVYLSLFPGLFAYAFAKLSLKLPGACFLLAPFLWVSTEYMRGHILTGFPWCLTGYALADYVNLAQIATITGVYGLSFLATWISALVTGLLFRFRLALGCLAMTVAALSGLAWVGVDPLEESGTEDAYARLVQTHIDLNQSWNQQSKPLILKEMTDLSLSPSVDDSVCIHEPDRQTLDATRVKLIIWPETPAPFYYHHDPPFQREMNALATASGSTLLFGFVDWRPESTDSNLGPYNSVGMLSPEGKLISQYDKMHLVPFGEYVPLSWVFFFIEKISTEVGDFQPGNQVVVADLESGERVGTFICYEGRRARLGAPLRSSRSRGPREYYQ